MIEQSSGSGVLDRSAKTSSFKQSPSDPSRGICKKCGVDYSFNGDGSSIAFSLSKKMQDHSVICSGSRK
jgi:hypothetical protein